MCAHGNPHAKPPVPIRHDRADYLRYFLCRQFRSGLPSIPPSLVKVLRPGRTKTGDIILAFQACAKHEEPFANMKDALHFKTKLANLVLVCTLITSSHAEDRIEIRRRNGTVVDDEQCRTAQQWTVDIDPLGYAKMNALRFRFGVPGIIGICSNSCMIEKQSRYRSRRLSCRREIIPSVSITICLLLVIDQHLANFKCLSVRSDTDSIQL